MSRINTAIRSGSLFEIRVNVYNPEDINSKIVIKLSWPINYSHSLCKFYPDISLYGTKGDLSPIISVNKTSFLLEEYFPLLITIGTETDHVSIEKYIWYKIKNNTESPIVLVEETYSTSKIIRLLSLVETDHTLISIKWVIEDHNQTRTDLNFKSFEIELNKFELRNKNISRVYCYVQSRYKNENTYEGEGFLWNWRFYSCIKSN